MKSTETVRSILARVVQIFLLAFLIVSAIIMLHAFEGIGGVKVSDPNKPFSPDNFSVEGNQSWVSTLLHDPWTYVTAGALIALVVVSLYRYVQFLPRVPGESSYSWWPLGIGVLVVGIILGGSLIKTDPSDDDQFKTWAYERYGIEMESYPTREGFYLGEEIDTGAHIQLDDGTMVKLTEIVDARGNRAYLVYASDAGNNGKELPRK